MYLEFTSQLLAQWKHRNFIVDDVLSKKWNDNRTTTENDSTGQVQIGEETKQQRPVLEHSSQHHYSNESAQEANDENKAELPGDVQIAVRWNNTRFLPLVWFRL